jgi:hypothetical protein
MPRDHRSAYVFVLGVGRCGSTLVHEVLARHPDVAFVSNVEDRLSLGRAVGSWNGSLYRRLPPSFSQKGRLRFAPSEAYRALEREVSPMLSAPARDLVADDASPWIALRLRRFFDERAAAQGRRVFLHKFTGWPRVGLLHRVFPEARFVHVIRDGRAVANSLLQMHWWRGYGGPEAWSFGPLSEADRREWVEAGRSFAVLAGLEYRILMDAFEAVRREAPGEAWREVRYEDFVAEPRATTRELLGFMGLEWSPDFERGFRRYRFDMGRTDAFRNDLPIGDVAALERVLAPTLARYGYIQRQDRTAEGDIARTERG